ncbi:MAG: hypothetical protein Q4E99_02030 [Bacillota bacterium]|nr:hypothetical protein [Bacillota bacterium]
MPNGNDKKNQDDFGQTTPEQLEEMRKKAEEAKKAAEEVMKKQMQSFKETRIKWQEERLNDLRSAKQALVDDMNNKLSYTEFIKRSSGAYGFWRALWAKMTVRKREEQFTRKISELDEMIAAQQKSIAEDKERERNLEKDTIKKDADGASKENFVDEKGDLGYHEYTGRGYKFEQARSETLAKTNSEKTLSGFKKNVYDRAFKDLDDKEQELTEQRNTAEEIIKSYVNEDLSYAELQDAYENRNRIRELQGQLDGINATEAENNKRLAEIAEEKAKLQKNIEGLQKKD